MFRSPAAVVAPTPPPTTLLVHVVDSASRRTLPNDEVSSPSVRRLMDAQGNARFTWPTGGAISVRVPAWLDSAASVLRRVDFRLVNVRDPRAPKQFQGYTTFSMPPPSIAVPDSTVACW